MPATEELETTEQLELSEVRRWRLAALRRAGFTEEHAQVLAARSDVDLHRAVDLVCRGCPPELAYSILV